MTVVGYIFARGGSKGVVGKNLRPAGGIPLITRAVRTALGSGCIDRLLVSTDDQAIADQAREAGAEVPFMRPDHLASDQANEWMAWQHAAEYSLESGIAAADELFVSIPTTTPLKRPDTVRHCVDFFRDGDYDIVVTGYQSNHHPAFNMVRRRSDEAVETIIKPEDAVSGRQAVPFAAYNMTTVCYVSTHRHVLAHNGIFDGRVGLCEVDHRIALDIDTEYDLAMADLVLNNLGDPLDGDPS